METGSLVIRNFGCDHAGEIAIHRYLSAASVACGEMVATLAARTAVAGSHVKRYCDGVVDRHLGRQVALAPARLAGFGQDLLHSEKSRCDLRGSGGKLLNTQR